MKNPYEHLFIYNFNGIPVLGRDIENAPGFLGLWVEDKTCFAFFQAEAGGLVKKIRAQNPDVDLIQSYEMTGEEWHGSRIESYFVGDLCIAPPWNRPERPVGPGQYQVLLDPGVVFGTGRHQTTEDCLSLILRLFREKRVESILDIGTGTGLLALGAAALGAKRVLACDFNLLAVRTCMANVRLNRFEDRVLAFQARGEEITDLDGDLLVANIHYDIMKDLIQTPGFLRKKYFILSGLLMSETRKILSRLADMPVHIIERRCPDGIWNTILGKRE